MMIMRKKRNVLYFVVILTAFVGLQLGFSLYANSFCGKFIHYKQKGLGSEQGLENVRAQTTTTVLTNADFKPESNWKPLKHRTTLITNRTCTHCYKLLIVVSSAPANLQRRNNIRKTWAFERAFKPRWTTVFLIAQTRTQSESDSLLKEDEIYGDLVRANYYDHYWNQTLKIQMAFEWATKYCKFSFLLKTDDDVFVNSAGLIYFLSKPTTPEKEFYMGRHYKNPWVCRVGKWKVTKEEYNGTHYPDFCPGFGYVLSHDVVVSFVKAFAFVPYFRLDDVYVGMLANRTGIKITHNAGFELDAQMQCTPNESTLVRHGFYKPSRSQGGCLIEIYNKAKTILESGLSETYSNVNISNSYLQGKTSDQNRILQ